MREQVIIDGGQNNKLYITCPFWANDLVKNLPSRKWNKSKRAWEVPLLKQNVDGVRQLQSMGGVTTTAAATSLLEEYDSTMATRVIVDRTAGMPPWYKYKTTPRKHQEVGVNKMYGNNAVALFMEMQTGKSKTTIDMLAAHRIEGHIQGALVFSKLTLRKNWIIQFDEHCPIPTSIHLPYVEKRRKFEAWLAHPHDFKIMIVGWESLSAGGMHELCERFLLSMSKCAIVGDESTFIAGHDSTRSKRAVSLARMAEYRYILSGSPSLEGPMQLFMQYEFLDPNIIGIGDYYAYRNRYAVMGGFTPKEGPMKGKPTQITGYQNLAELSALIAPYTYEVLKKDAYDLPPKRYEVRTVVLTPAQKEVYRRIKKEKYLTCGVDADGIEIERAIQNTLELMLRLHQVAGGYTVTAREEIRYDSKGNPKPKTVYDPVEVVPPEDNPKIKELIEIVAEAKHAGKQGIVWAAYRSEIAAIASTLRGLGLIVGELHGGVPEAERQPMVNAFKVGEVEWIVGNAGTGGMGYTMMASEVNIFYNNTPKAIDRVQAEDRAWGDGQTKSGIWIDIVAEGTVDALFLKALRQKMDVADFVRQNIREAIELLDGD